MTQDYSPPAILVKRLTETAKLPTKAYAGDAGWDLYADQDATINVGDIVKINTGIALEIPNGYVGLIWDRSSLGVKGIHRLAGVVDSGFRNGIKVCLCNVKTDSLFHKLLNLVSIIMNYLGKPNDGIIQTSIDDYKVAKGDKIAQLLIQEVPEFVMVEVSELAPSERGERGFGSSGIS